MSTPFKELEAPSLSLQHFQAFNEGYIPVSHQGLQRGFLYLIQVVVQSTHDENT